jgi:hypothetical protein
MSQSTAVAFPEAEVPSIPLTELGPWALLFGLVSALVIFFVSSDQGAVSIPAGTAIHEFVHDGRHLLAYPCH